MLLPLTDPADIDTNEGGRVCSLYQAHRTASGDCTIRSQAWGDDFERSEQTRIFSSFRLKMGPQDTSPQARHTWVSATIS